MKFKIKLVFIILNSIILFLSACVKPQQYPKEPQIDYQKTVVREATDTLGNPVLRYSTHFYVIDGDQNVGLSQADITGIFASDQKYHNNLFVEVLDRENGIFVPATYFVMDSSGVWVEDTLQYNFRIPKTEQIGLNDYFKAEVIFDIELQTNLLPTNYDTIKFRYYIVDKEINPSNTQETHELIIGETGIYIDTIQVFDY